MKNIIKQNSYLILGLYASANPREINKRGKEILRRLHIGDTPEYDADVGIFSNFRNEENTKNAIQRLSMPKKKIVDTLFWFEIINENDLKAINANDHNEAINIWGEYIDKDTPKSLLHVKNLAVLNTILLYTKEGDNFIEDSLRLWKDLFEKDKFWKAFFNSFRAHHEVDVSDHLLEDLRKEATDLLADVFTELSSLHNDKVFINSFHKEFKVMGQKLKKEILDPAFEGIDKAVKDMENLKVSEDGVLDSDEKRKIKELVETIKIELNKLIDVGLYDDSKVKIMRDRAASAIRTVSIDINNNLNEAEIALGLVKIAKEISGTEGTKNSAKADVEIIENNLNYKNKEKEYKKILDPIMGKIEAGKYEKAMEEINTLLYNQGTDLELKKVLQEIKTNMEERVVKHGKPIKKAPSMHTINGVGTRVYGDTQYFVFLFIPIIPIARYTVINHGNGSYSFLGKLELHQWQKIWKFIAIAVLVIWFIVIMSDL